ncbi:hypothetical protein OESDEN_11283 [Oesophagostomum dentatum]|uniref:Uncharacterized protein n=1 Tax=Oesophagostomum dentatum TaxID=61180 RepID=A0A0B1SZG7_OESDE|nr:hypothetical protein OESDEN_11283 [Oesophagostomum dentatum]
MVLPVFQQRRADKNKEFGKLRTGKDDTGPKRHVQVSNFSSVATKEKLISDTLAIFASVLFRKLRCSSFYSRDYGF